ncbi:FUSC family protein [Devosia ginsengisoli]|uniref:FUSC family protein n=1 Tax=Devosia ginsengisoli TaxID=400770 RepID=UPI0026EA0F35|nr:FUSC family protein [Devosia ginsengisoli]MCR6670671.1 FUSC family protein [Devosia ginsengisoli]
MAANRNRPGLFGILVDELRPYEGRLGASLRMALCCVLVVALAMSQHVPEAAVSCYLIFFASRDNAASGIAIALALIVGVSVGILLGLLFLQLVSDEPMLRLGFMAAFTFGGMYFSVATKAGPIAATIGFVFAFVMTLNDFVPVPELLSRGLSWMWVVVFFPMAVLILANALIGPNPARLVRHRLAQRLRAAAAILRGAGDEQARALLSEPAGELAAPARLGALFGYHSKNEASRVTALMPMVQDLLAETSGTPADGLLAKRLDQLAEAIEFHRALDAGWRPVGLLAQSAPLAERVGRIAAVWSGRLVVPGPVAVEQGPADTFSNPAYMQFALKTMLAVFITYTIYTAFGWFEIHTAMITCFYVALGTAGETLHKAALRIVGCLIGAAMGMGSIVFLMPGMTDIGQLLLLVAAGSFIAAWVANGSNLVQYAGWQMALAFFLCVLQGYGPAFDISVATNRILGILIGNVVVTIIFLWLWPTSVGALTAQHLASAVQGLGAALRQAGNSLAAVTPELKQARRLSRLSAFEARRLRASAPLLPYAAAIMTAMEDATEKAGNLRRLRARPRYMFGAPRCVKAATLAHEASASRFLDVAASSILQPDPEARTMLQQALSQSTSTLARLEHQLASTSPRAAWRRDFEQTVEAHRDLAQGFARALAAL